MFTQVYIGPPGTGKTTTLAKLTSEAVEAGRRPLICSLTKAAAAEIAGRHLPIPREAVGTLHSHAYHALGRPELVQKHIGEWNEAEPAYILSDDNSSGDDPYTATQDTQGDQLRAAMDLWRARKIDRRLWPDRLKAFVTRWEAWKNKAELVDFTDLIERAALYSTQVPGRADLICLDEAQDLSRLELDLVRQWARTANNLIIVGDPWQALYTWRGAYPQMFTSDKIAADHRHIREQSYRVPRAVHTAETHWVRQLSDWTEIKYRPRDADGLAARTIGSWRLPAPILDLAERHLDASQSVMICGSCGFHLHPTLTEARHRGLPFANPWKVDDRRGWNPLHVARGVSMAERLLDFLLPDDAINDEPRLWTATELERWLKPLKTTGTLQRGAKQLIAHAVKADGISAMSSRVVTLDDLPEWFDDAVINDLEAMVEGRMPTRDALRWYHARLTATKQKVIQYPIQVLQKHGAQALRNPPRLYIGTIHSFKGGEADVVIVYPDLSLRGMQAWLCHGEGRDAVVRMYYVALTRAREKVYVCQPATDLACDVCDYVENR